MMREDSKDRYCKACGADWLGEAIPLKNLSAFNSPYKFEEYKDIPFPHNYETFEKDILDSKLDGRPEMETHFSRRIGIYSRDTDRTVANSCPDCGDRT